MEDKLKKLVQENRAAFDLHQTDYESLWEDIDTGLEVRKKKPFTTVWRVAASIVIVLGVGWMMYSNYGTAPQRVRQGVALHQISAELAETELYYSGQINEKLRIIQSSNPELGTEVFEGLSILDSAYMELKQDLKDDADNEEVINAMIQNYRIKLELLEQILEEIKDNNDGEDKNEDARI